LPSLKSKKEDGEMETHKSNGSKVALLHKGFFPTAKTIYSIGGAYVNPKFPFEEIQDVQIIWVSNSSVHLRHQAIVDWQTYSLKRSQTS
jgi:hypothetical protein